MTIDLNFLVFIITLLTAMGAAFGFFTKLLVGIKNDGAQTKEMVAGLKSEIRNTKEFHNCEFDRVDKRLDDLTEKLNGHEGRIVRLESK